MTCDSVTAPSGLCAQSSSVSSWPLRWSSSFRPGHVVRLDTLRHLFRRHRRAHARWSRRRPGSSRTSPCADRRAARPDTAPGCRARPAPRSTSAMRAFMTARASGCILPRTTLRAGLDDAGLFFGDLRERVAELDHVIEGDARDRGDERGRDHVRRVETAAEADLEHRDVDLRVAEREKRRDRRDLEEREIRRRVHHAVQ